MVWYVSRISNFGSHGLEVQSPLTKVLTQRRLVLITVYALRNFKLGSWLDDTLNCTVVYMCSASSTVQLSFILMVFRITFFIVMSSRTSLLSYLL